MIWSTHQIKQGRRGPRQLALAACTALFCTVTPSLADAQACAAGQLSSYISSAPQNSCTIGGVTLNWGQFAMAGDLSRVLVTPLSGASAFGSYFGFRFVSSDGNPLVSTQMTAADAAVPNPGYDPNDPNSGSPFLPFMTPTNRSGFRGWKFTHSLTAPFAIKRLELQTTGSRASSTSQLPVAPTLNALGEPDVNSGCGWGYYDDVLGQRYDAANRCAFFGATSNNFLWRTISTDNSVAQTVRSSNGQYRLPDATGGYCLEDSAPVAQPGPDCISFTNLGGIDFGTSVHFGLSQLVNAMSLFGPPTDLGYFDIANQYNLGASASLDEAEFRIYYQEEVPSTVVPEPSTWALMATGLAGVLLAARRRRV